MNNKKQNIIAVIIFIVCLAVLPIAHLLGLYIAFPSCAGKTGDELELCIQICKLRQMFNGD